MKILLVHNYYQLPGGEDVVFAAEKKMLLAQGHEVKTYIDSNQRIIKLGKVTSFLQTFWSKASYQALEKIIVSFKPDLVHVHNTFMLISPAVYDVCQKYRIPVVQTLHNYRLLCLNACFSRENRPCELCLTKQNPWWGVRYKCYRNSYLYSLLVALYLTVQRWRKTWQTKITTFIALTPFAANKFSAGHIPTSKIVVKPNFVSDQEVQAPALTQDYALYLGRLSVEKGVLDMLQDWENLAIPLKIAGDGPLKNQVELAAQKNPWLEYLGQVEHAQIKTLLAQASFLVFPSLLYEGLPMTVLEAFAVGTPVIANYVAGREDLIENGKNGLFYNKDVNSPYAGILKEKALWLWQNPRQNQNFKQAAYQTYKKNYSEKENYARLLTIYQQAIQQNRKR